MLEAYDAVQRHMIATGESWQQVAIPPEIYAAVASSTPIRARRSARRPVRRAAHRRALVLYEGKIAEMATGEGKTFVAPLACFMRVLEGLHCHVVTVNDYLVRPRRVVAEARVRQSRDQPSATSRATWNPAVRAARRCTSATSRTARTASLASTTSATT
jgi:hypothetical protein